MNASQEMSLAEGLRSFSHPAQFSGCGWLGWLGCLVELLGRLRAQLRRNLFNLGSSLDTKQGSGDLRTGGCVFPGPLRR